MRRKERRASEARHVRRNRTGCPEKHGRKAKRGQDNVLDRRHCERHQIPMSEY